MSDQSAIYAILYDRDLIDTEDLHRFIATSKMVENWWHYIKSCYLIKSVYSADQIADAMPESLRVGFLIVEVNIGNSSGWLSDRAWRWISRRQNEFQE